ncbi:MAG: LysR substrate-binding domain-containing protein [Burkholderiales bacterium]|nr:LysR substrate-binding domain-containing protein [Burkholderiales bacterium]
MKLQQLRYLCEIVDRGLNVSRAAASLHTSQPGVSKQIRLLEEELGSAVLERRATRVTGLTATGRAILPAARRMLLEAENLQRQARESAAAGGVRLTIATTHTHARYALLPALKRFIQRYPGVELELRQATPQRIAQLVAAGAADIGIATMPVEHVPGLAWQPCYRIDHIVIAPSRHPLLRERNLSLASLARFPLVTYDASFRFGHLVRERFMAQGLEPNIVISAIDSDVIKAYVEAGFGVAILPATAYSATRDKGLRSRPANHLFAPNICYVMTLEGRHLEPHLQDFVTFIRSAQPKRAAPDADS